MSGVVVKNVRISCIQTRMETLISATSETCFTLRSTENDEQNLLRPTHRMHRLSTLQKYCSIRFHLNAGHWSYVPLMGINRQRYKCDKMCVREIPEREYRFTYAHKSSHQPQIKTHHKLDEKKKRKNKTLHRRNR